MDQEGRDMEFGIVIGDSHLFDELPQSRQKPAIHLRHVGIRNGILFRVEPAQIAEKESCGVSNATIRLRQIGKDRFGYADIAPVVGRSYPEPQYISSVSVDDFLRADDISDGFGHFASFSVDDKSVRQHTLERRSVARRD